MSTATPDGYSEAQVYAGWTRQYRDERQARQEIDEQARLAGIRRRRIEDILEASRLERLALSEVWES